MASYANKGERKVSSRSIIPSSKPSQGSETLTGGSSVVAPPRVETIGCSSSGDRGVVCPRDSVADRNIARPSTCLD